MSDQLAAALRDLECDLRVALTHYAPVADTLAGEPPEIYPFLGSFRPYRDRVSGMSWN